MRERGFANFSLAAPIALGETDRTRSNNFAVGEKPMRPHFRGLSRLAAIFTIVLGLCSQIPSRAVAAENWDLYVYNPVATVAAVKGMNTIIEQIEKETNSELKVRLHLGGSLPINTTNITQAVSDDVVRWATTAISPAMCRSPAFCGCRC
jgi:hypothetical protein